MNLTTTGRIGGSKFPVGVRFDDREPDVLLFTFLPRTPGWVIGRDLLAAGLMAEAGELDVVVRPEPDTDEVALVLGTEAGKVIIRLPWDPIAAFVRRAYEHVPRGCEYDGLDWGQLLATTGGAA